MVGFFGATLFALVDEKVIAVLLEPVNHLVGRFEISQALPGAFHPVWGVRGHRLPQAQQSKQVVKAIKTSGALEYQPLTIAIDQYAQRLWLGLDVWQASKKLGIHTTSKSSQRPYRGQPFQALEAAV